MKFATNCVEVSMFLRPAISRPEIFLTIQKSAERRRVIRMNMAMKEEVNSQPNKYRTTDITYKDERNLRNKSILYLCWSSDAAAKQIIWKKKQVKGKV